jgi:hypothetical protein
MNSLPDWGENSFVVKASVNQQLSLFENTSNNQTSILEKLNKKYANKFPLLSKHAVELFFDVDNEGKEIISKAEFMEIDSNLVISKVIGGSDVDDSMTHLKKMIDALVKINNSDKFTEYIENKIEIEEPF